MQNKKGLGFITLFLKPICLGFFFMALCRPAAYADNNTQLSESAQISIITGTPGDDLYAAFGHSAIHIIDTANQIEVLYNYGVFDFDTPNFYLKFVQGKLMYQLAITDFEDLKEIYKEGKRGLSSQVLNLSRQQKQAIWDFLIENYKPENREYKYDFFFDNCATRIRDVLMLTLGDNLQWDFKQFPPNKTFRDLIWPYIKEKQWLALGMNLILGLPVDRKASFKEYLFLPDYIALGLSDAKVRVNGNMQPLVSEVKSIQTVEQTASKELDLFGPPFVLWTIALLLGGITYWEYKNKRILYAIDFVLYLLSGSAGILFLLLWFGTDHQTLPYNWNLIWAIPFHVAIAFVILFPGSKKWLKYYNLFTILLGSLNLIFWAFLPQALPWAVYPVVLLITLRNMHMYLRKDGVVPDFIQN